MDDKLLDSMADNLVEIADMFTDVYNALFESDSKDLEEIANIVLYGMVGAYGFGFLCGKFGKEEALKHLENRRKIDLQQ